MEDLTAGECKAIQVWAIWYLELQENKVTPTAGNRAAIEARAARHLSELVRHLEAVAQAKGRDVDIPDSLFFRDLLEILSDLGISPAAFFAGVIRRWRRNRRPPDPQ